MRNRVPGSRLQINSRPADEAGIFVAFRWMTNEVRRLMDDEQMGVLVKDVKQRLHARGSDHAQSFSPI